MTHQASSQEEIQLLAETSNLLAGCTDYATTIQMIAKLLVSTLAVWCAVDLVDKDGKIRREAVAHRDPKKADLADIMLKRYHAKPTAKRGVYRVINTGQSVLIPHFPDSDWAERADNPEHFQILVALGSTSYMCVPLIARGRTVGSIMLLSNERTYNENDLHTAEEVARRIALAVDNVMMFQRMEKALKARDDFFAVLSHELKTPISVIQGWIDVLRTKEVDKATLDQALRVLDRNARLQASLIKDLLDASCISAGKMRMESKEIDLVAVLKASVDSVMLTASEKRLSLETRFDRNEFAIQGDFSNLQRVLVNLLINSTKFTPSGGSIVVSLKTSDQEALITIADTGKGIAPEFLPNAFDAFQQESGTSSRAYSGLGLGLSIAKHIVEHHHGVIEIASPGIGKGTQATIRIPSLARNSSWSSEPNSPNTGQFATQTSATAPA